MTTTVFASFQGIPDAERAIGALLDHGVRSADISLVVNEPVGLHQADDDGMALTRDETEIVHEQGRTGITTTTPSDAGVGAAKGASVGLGVGIAAALASVFIPGVGLILGAGTWALALAATAGATGAGAIAGGALGYLKDQGVPEAIVAEYNLTYVSGGAVLGVNVTDRVGRDEIEAILAKYSALNVNYYNLEPTPVNPSATLL